MGVWANRCPTLLAVPLVGSTHPSPRDGYVQPLKILQLGQAQDVQCSACMVTNAVLAQSLIAICCQSSGLWCSLSVRASVLHSPLESLTRAICHTQGGYMHNAVLYLLPFYPGQTYCNRLLQIGMNFKFLQTRTMSQVSACEKKNKNTVKFLTYISFEIKNATV